MNPPSCPPPPLLLKGGRNFQKFGGEVATFLLLCSSILFTVGLCVCLWWKGGGDSLYYFLDLQSFQLVMQDSHSSLYCTDTWYHLHISDPFW